MQMISRRNFIKQASAASTSLMLVQSGLRLNIAKKPVVICIGGGLSGLAAAYTLKKKGLNVKVLESRSRIGGRVFSHNITNKLIIELGGEWVGNSHTRIREMCDQFSLRLINNQFNTHLIYKSEYAPPGKWSYTEEWENKYKFLLENYGQLSELDKISLDKYDWWHYLVNNGCNGKDLDVKELLDSTDFGESIRHVSAFAALSEYAESSQKNEMDLKIEGGNKMLIEKLADAIGRENILLRHEVTKIEQTDEVRVYCGNGAIFSADKIICTIPTCAIGKISWHPQLPQHKKDAISQLQYARINKHAVLFKERFWKDESFDLITDETPHYFYHATKLQPGPEGVLISYSIGDKAAVMANRNNNDNARDIIRILEPHFSGIGSKMKDQINYYWGNDEISRGAYAFYGIGQWFSLRPVLKQPFLHTYFAGEHIADWQGFMEGAVNTGEAAALEIIN